MQGYNPQNPVIVQGDKTVLLEVDNPRYAEARDMLARFAELVKSPEYVHTYQLSSLSLWNAAAAGVGADVILRGLEEYSKYPLPDNVRRDIIEAIGRYGRIKIVKLDDKLLLTSDDAVLMEEVSRHKSFQQLVTTRLGPNTFELDPGQRGHVKRVLLQIGFPAEDLAGYNDGDPLAFALSAISKTTGAPFNLRHYQTDAADTFWSGGSEGGGSGVIVLPCGAGKTMVGMAAMVKVQTATLILCPNTVAVRQWQRELLDKTTLTADQIGEYTGAKKEIKPVTLCTYQVLTYKPRKGKGLESVGGSQNGDDSDYETAEAFLAAKSKFTRSSKKLPKLSDYPHMQVFGQLNWGLIVYDEVHLLPAPVFRMTAEIQAKRRLGLTATLVREDGAEGDVFSLVGPKKYDVPWRELEKQGWIATAECHEVRVQLDDEDRMEYAVISFDKKYRFAATNRVKLPIISMLLSKHREDQVLVIGQYLDQLAQIAARIDAPMITGETPVKQREILYNQFRNGEISRLVLSKVGNFSVDLPDATVLIQVSGAFGSRQEEAQRLGRVLRPKANGLLAHFYSIVARDTLDQEFAAKRQMFLTEQGYAYDILYQDEVPSYIPAVLAGQSQEVSFKPAGALTAQADASA